MHPKFLLITFWFRPRAAFICNICTNPKNPCAKFCLNSSSTQTLFQKKRYPYNITCITLLVDLHKDLAPFWKLSIFLSYQYCRKFQPLQKPSRCQILLFLMTSHHDALLSRLGVQSNCCWCTKVAVRHAVLVLVVHSAVDCCWWSITLLRPWFFN